MNETDLRVLKNILSDRKSAIDFVNNNDARIFSSETWNFANLACNYIKKYQDIPTERILKELAGKTGNEVFEQKVSEMWDTVFAVDAQLSELNHDIDKLKTRTAEAEIFSLKSELVTLKPGSFNVHDVLSKFKRTTQQVHGLYNDSLCQSKNVKDYLGTFVDQFNLTKNSPEETSGIMTGYSFIDYAINGLKPADMVLIAGESGHGKSIFLQNIAVQMWKQKNNISDSLNDFSNGKNIIYFSLEMPYEDCFNRFLSMLSGVQYRKIENASLNKEEFARVKDVLTFIKQFPNSFRIVDITNACANDLEAEMLKTGETFDSMFVDYLGIMPTNDKSDEADWLKQGTVSYELRHVARKYRFPLFSAVQLNRKAQKEGSDNIGLSRLARSAGIATHATHVIQIESRQKEEQYPDFLFHFIKNRKGPKGKGVLNKNFSCSSLTDKAMDVEDFGYSDLAGDISAQLESVEDLDLDFLK